MSLMPGQSERLGHSVLRAVRAALLLGLFAWPAQAQTAYSQEKLESFADAVVAVQEIAEKWLPRINDAGSDSAAQQLNQQAEAEVTAAIEAMPGITVAEYLDINTRASSDPILASRINDILRAKIGR